MKVGIQSGSVIEAAPKIECYFNDDKSCIFDFYYLFSYNEPYNF